MSTGGATGRSGREAVKPPPFPLALPEVAGWVALHTHPRAEKVVARFLATKRVGFYLPLHLTRRSYDGRIRTAWVPAFPGYLFFDAGVTDRHLIYGSRRVARVLVPEDPGGLEADLQNFALAAAALPALEAIEFPPPGTPVEVIAGPLEGVKGEMVRRHGATGLVLRVGFIHQAVEIEIDAAEVRPIQAGG